MPRIQGLTDDWEAWMRTVSPGLSDFAPHHRETGRWLQSIRPGIRPTAEIDIWPRGHGKSTNAEHGVAYLAERKKRTFALYICDTQDAAERHVQNVASILERIGGPVGTRLENQYGHSKGWKKSMIRTASGFSIIGLGFDVAMRGIKLEDFRPDLIIFDDIDGRHDTLATTEKKIETLTESILPAGSPDCAIWGVQNLIIPHGIFSRLADGRADFLANRRISGPHKAVKNLVTEQRYVEEWPGLGPGDGSTTGASPINRRIHVITGGTPSWPVHSLETCQRFIIDYGFKAFDREMQQNVKDVEGALWTSKLLSETRIAEVDFDANILTRIVVAVDPASTSKTSSDETGIIGCGRDAEAHGYVLEDDSGRYKPSEWGRRAVLMHDRLRAECIVGEKNQGGEMVEEIIKTAAKNLHEEGLRPTSTIRVKLVHASKGKRARAEPVAQKYDEHTIHHVGDHVGLEEQMTTWNASDGSESPDRVDALTWGMTELLPLYPTFSYGFGD